MNHTKYTIITLACATILVHECNAMEHKARSESPTGAPEGFVRLAVESIQRREIGCSPASLASSRSHSPQIQQQSTVEQVNSPRSDRSVRSSSRASQHDAPLSSPARAQSPFKPIDAASGVGATNSASHSDGLSPILKELEGVDSSVSAQSMRDSSPTSQQETIPSGRSHSPLIKVLKVKNESSTSPQDVKKPVLLTTKQKWVVAVVAVSAWYTYKKRAVIIAQLRKWGILKKEETTSTEKKDLVTEFAKKQ